MGSKATNRRKKAEKIADTQSHLLFPLPQFKFTIWKPQHVTLSISTHIVKGEAVDHLLTAFASHSTTLPRSTHIGIPNAKFKDDTSLPRYAAWRFTNCITEEEQRELRRSVDDVANLGLKTHTIESRGTTFHQWWFGVWCRYAIHSFISADSREKKTAQSVFHFCRCFDQVFGKRPQHLLVQIDPSIAKSMLLHHRAVAVHIRYISHPDNPLQEKRNMPSTTRAVSTSHQTNTSYRLGGMGCMLAVSWGEGTEWHYDVKDSERTYTVISVLGRASLLHLPQLGCTIPLKPGDVVGFLAGSLLHKLEVDPSSPDTGEKQIVFTCWTDKVTKKNIKEYNDFHHL